MFLLFTQGCGGYQSHSPKSYQKNHTRELDQTTQNQTIEDLTKENHSSTETSNDDQPEIYKLKNPVQHLPEKSLNKLTNDDILVLIYETDSQGDSARHLDYLLDGLLHNNVYYYVLGQDDPWQGFGGKILKIKDLLQNPSLNSNPILVISDARDVIANKIEGFFSQRFKSTFNLVSNQGQKIVFGGEKACCVGPMWHFPPKSFITTEKKRIHFTVDHYEDNEDTRHQNVALWTQKMEQIQSESVRTTEEGKKSQHRYLNAGLCAGRLNSILKLYSDVQIKAEEDDQAVFSDYFIHFPEVVTVDYENKIFNNSFVGGGENDFFYALKDPKSKSSSIVIKDSFISGAEPFFIQTPGKRWDYYHQIKDLLNYSRQKQPPS